MRCFNDDIREAEEALEAIERLKAMYMAFKAACKPYEDAVLALTSEIIEFPDVDDCISSCNAAIEATKDKLSRIAA